jgi:hypothetical protein
MFKTTYYDLMIVFKLYSIFKFKKLRTQKINSYSYFILKFENINDKDVLL